MKILQHILIGVLFVAFASACNEGIDPISKVNPGPDQSAPVVTIQYPTEGTEIKVPKLVASITISLEVTDDIEIESITVSIDGSQIAIYNEFLDYRRVILELEYDNVTDGAHVLTVTAKDTEGKTTSESVNFQKALPYIPKYEGEILYLPFDGEYLDLISFQYATEVGMPGFTDENVVGGKAYAGATDAYLTFPGEDLQTSEFSAVFWMKINAVPDRAGILNMSIPNPDNSSDGAQRINGFRFFRENAAGKQRFKLNAGDGAAEIWVDGAEMADVDPATTDWIHFAFTISSTECRVYINGQMVKESEFAGIDWTGCDELAIMSGGSRFQYWSHNSDLSYMDELRLFSRILSQEDIQQIIFDESGQTAGYTPKYDGEIFYMPFEDAFTEKVTDTEPTVVGTPGFDEGKIGKAYAGAADSYLEFPTAGLQGDAFSAVFWMKINADPDRGGILVASPPNPDNLSDGLYRQKGFRFFREGSSTSQIFKLNAGTGDTEGWFDGGAAATLDPTAVDWVHLAFTISGTECVVYIDGEVVSSGDFVGMDWTDCNVLTIMSGNPDFVYWSHFSDLSLLDELRLFNKALTQEEIQAIISDES
jgi:hypothetical protein